MVVRSLWKKYGKRLERWADFLLTVVACGGLGFLLWMLLQVTSLTSFRIPTESMQPTLIPGDYILVEKWTMGGRIFDLPDAAEGKEVEIRRLPGFGKVERNDVLVFNFPHHHRWDSIGMDLMVYYVKRCIGLPGDTVSIRNGYYRVAVWRIHWVMSLHNGVWNGCWLRTGSRMQASPTGVFRKTA